jgi:hypothetical protein
MNSGKLLSDLSSAFTEPVRDPVWGSIYLSEGLEALAGSEPFAKLARIKQLGPASLVYPGATHSRRAHSLGVLHMARRLATALAARGGLEFVSREGLFSYLAAALCHDLGHFPFAHSLKELPLEAHEVLTGRIILEEPLRGLVGAAGADPDLTAAIVDEGRAGSGGIKEERELHFFRGLLSGVLDPDKLDYLNRDAFFCGVPYGLQDTDYALQRVRVGPGDRLCVEERGLMSVESLLFSKYLMYRSVYWHKGVRAATAMVKKAVLLALEEGILEVGELYGLDDDGFYARIRSLPSRSAAGAAPCAPAESVFQGRVYPVILDIPFEQRRHESLLDLGARLVAEEDLATRASTGVERLSPTEVVIDIPESVSFETDLPILEEGSGTLPFSECATVFSPPVVAGFGRILRRVRVCVARPSEKMVKAARDLLA